MVIQINYDPGIAAVSKLSYQAGKGEFMKWKAGFDQRADQYRAQALLGGFGAGSRLGLGISNLRQQRHLGEQRNALFGRQIASREKGIADKALQEANRKQAQLALLLSNGELLGYTPDQIRNFAETATADDIEKVNQGAASARTQHSLATMAASPRAAELEATATWNKLEAGNAHREKIEALVNQGLQRGFTSGAVSSVVPADVEQFKRNLRDHYTNKFGLPPTPVTGATRAKEAFSTVSADGRTVTYFPDGSREHSLHPAAIAKMELEAAEAQYNSSPHVRELNLREHEAKVKQEEWRASPQGQALDRAQTIIPLMSQVPAALESIVNNPNRPKVQITKTGDFDGDGVVETKTFEVPAPLTTEEIGGVLKFYQSVLGQMGVGDIFGGGQPAGGTSVPRLPPPTGGIQGWRGGGMPPGYGPDVEQRFFGPKAAHPVPGYNPGGPAPSGTPQGFMPSGQPEGWPHKSVGPAPPPSYARPPGQYTEKYFPEGTPLPRTVDETPVSQFDALQGTENIRVPGMQKAFSQLQSIFKSAKAGNIPQTSTEVVPAEAQDAIRKQLATNRDVSEKDISNEEVQETAGAVASRVSVQIMKTIDLMETHINFEQIKNAGYSPDKDKQVEKFTQQISAWLRELEAIGYRIDGPKPSGTGVQKYPFGKPVGAPQSRKEYLPK